MYANIQKIFENAFRFFYTDFLMLHPSCHTLPNTSLRKNPIKIHHKVLVDYLTAAEQ